MFRSQPIFRERAKLETSGMFLGFFWHFSTIYSTFRIALLAGGEQAGVSGDDSVYLFVNVFSVFLKIFNVKLRIMVMLISGDKKG